MNTVAEICNELKHIQSCTIIMHRRPDGDTGGSAAALGRCLMALGKTVRFACCDAITPKYTDLLPAPVGVAVEGAVIAVDIAAPEMAGALAPYVEQADIVIDHHGTNPCPGRLNLVRPEAAATGEIMYEIVTALGPLTKEIAEALYVALSTDTGCFRYGNTTPNALRVGAALVETGLDITYLNRMLFVVKTKAAFAVRSRLSQELHYYADGHAAVSVLSEAIMREYHADEDDVESVSAIPMEIEGVRAAATLREVATRTYKVSVRTDGSVDAAALCKAFDGGGHKMAAGCTLQGNVEDCEKQMAKALCEALGAEWTD